MRLLESAGVSIEGLYAVVLGRSDIVGSPVAAMLRNKDATVTQCHSKTKDLPEIVHIRSAWLTMSLTAPQIKKADILVAAIGKPEFVQGSWLKPGVIVVDVGTNYIPGVLAHFQLVRNLTVPRFDEEIWAAIGRRCRFYFCFSSCFSYHSRTRRCWAYDCRHAYA